MQFQTKGSLAAGLIAKTAIHFVLCNQKKFVKRLFHHFHWVFSERELGFELGFRTAHVRREVIRFICLYLNIDKM